MLFWMILVTFVHAWWLAVMVLFFVRMPAPTKYLRRPWVGPLLWSVGTGLLGIAYVRYFGAEKTNALGLPVIGWLRLGPVGVLCAFLAPASFSLFSVGDGKLMEGCARALLGRDKCRRQDMAVREATKYQGTHRWLDLVMCLLLSAIGISLAFGVHLLDQVGGPAAVEEIAALAIDVTMEEHRADLLASLLEEGVDPDVRLTGQEGRTALHVAARTGDSDAAKVLLDHGADANARDDRGKTPLDYAIETWHGGVAKLLREHGAAE